MGAQAGDVVLVDSDDGQEVGHDAGAGEGDGVALCELAADFLEVFLFFLFALLLFALAAFLVFAALFEGLLEQVLDFPLGPLVVAARHQLLESSLPLERLGRFRDLRKLLSQIREIIRRDLHMHLVVRNLPEGTLLQLSNLHPPILRVVLDRVEILQHKVIVIHVPPHAGDDDVAVLLHPQRVLLPASLVPLRLRIRARGRHVSDHDGLHAAVAQELQLDAQPLHMAVAGLGLRGAAVDGRVRLEEVHGVEAEDGEVVRNDFDGEPAALLEGVLLHFRDELPPDVEEGARPAVRALGHDVVRQDVVVADVRDDGHDVVVVRVRVLLVAVVLAEDFCQLAHHELVQTDHLLRRAGQLLVVVVPRGVARPYHEVHLVLQLLPDPFHRLVDQRDRAVAIADLGAVDAGGALSMVAGVVLTRRGVYFVKAIGMEICVASEAAFPKASSVPVCIPVMCRKRPWSGRCFDDCPAPRPNGIIFTSSLRRGACSVGRAYDHCARPQAPSRPVSRRILLATIRVFFSATGAQAAGMPWAVPGRKMQARKI